MANLKRRRYFSADARICRGMGDRGSFRFARIAGIDLRLHYSWILIAALITLSLSAHFSAINRYWGMGTIWAAAVITGLLFFVGLIAHELSHAMVAKARGLPIHKITLFLLGGVAQIEREAPTASTEFWMAIAGPIMSVAIGFLCLGLAYLAGWRYGSIPVIPVSAVLVWLGYINLILAAFNMIPGFPMDGGRVLRAIIWRATRDADKATRIAAGIGQGVGWLFIVYGIWQLFVGRGFGSLWIALIGWFLIQSATSTVMRSRAESALQNLRTSDLMTRNYGSVQGALDLQTFVDDDLLRSANPYYLVREGGHVVGLVTPAEIRNVDRVNWATTHVRDVMISLANLQSLRPETPVFEALDTMARADANQLPVIEHGTLVGILNRGSVFQALRNRSDLKAA